MIDFPEQDLPNFAEIATGLAQSWPQIREITLHPYLDDPDFTSKHSFVIVIQHNGSFHDVEEGKFLEHVCGFLRKKNFSNKQYDECLIWPIGPDESFPGQAVKDVSTTLYKREGTTGDEALRQRTQPHDEMWEERVRLEQEECDRNRDKYFEGSDTRISEENKKEMADRLLLGRKPQPPISSMSPAEINEMRARMSQPPLSAEILKEMTATEEAPHWRIMAKQAMKPTDSLSELEPFTPETPDRPTSTPAPKHTDIDTFIRSLQVSYLDNTTIKIQYKGKRIDYTCQSIGFRDSKTKGWVTFLKILEDENNLYRLGPAHFFNKTLKQRVRAKEYDSRLKLLKLMNEKLISFLTQQYNVSFPPDFKLYEPQPDKGPGVYSFIFKIPSHKPSYKTKDQALRLLETLIQEEASNEKIQQAIETAMDAGATQDEVFEIVKDRLTSPQKYSETADKPEDGDEDKEE